MLRTDERTDERTYERTDGRTDGRSGPTTRPAFAKATQVKIGALNLAGIMILISFLVVVTLSWSLLLAPITTATDNNFRDIFPNFR